MNQLLRYKLPVTALNSNIFNKKKTPMIDPGLHKWRMYAHIHSTVLKLWLFYILKYTIFNNLLWNRIVAAKNNVKNNA